MRERFGSSNWSLQVAEGWDTCHDADCASIARRELGCGALQLSAALRDSEVTDGDLLDFAAKEVEAGLKGVPVLTSEFGGYLFTFVRDGAFWRRWYLRKGSLALFVTYNCNVEERGVEDADVDEMMVSLSTIAAG